MPSLVFELNVEMEDGSTYAVVADQRDIARWEVQPFGWPVAQMEESVSMTFFRFLAWSAAFRQQLTSWKWEEFDGRCVEAMPPADEEGDGEEGEGKVPVDAEDPGRPAPSGGRSSTSRRRRVNP